MSGDNLKFFKGELAVPAFGRTDGDGVIDSSCLLSPENVQRLLRELREAADMRCETCRLLQDEQCESGQDPAGYCPDWEAKP